MQPSQARKILKAIDQKLSSCPVCGHSGPIDSIGDHVVDATGYECPVIAMIVFSMDEDEVSATPTLRWTANFGDFSKLKRYVKRTIIAGTGDPVWMHSDDEGLFDPWTPIPDQPREEPADPEVPAVAFGTARWRRHCSCHSSDELVECTVDQASGTIPRCSVCGALWRCISVSPPASPNFRTE